MSNQAITGSKSDRPPRNPEPELGRETREHQGWGVVATGAGKPHLKHTSSLNHGVYTVVFYSLNAYNPKTLSPEMNISILIPTCNRPKELLECIKSCITQTHTPWEILIGDDSINDECNKVVSSFKENKFNIRYFHNSPSLGQADNIDALIHAATGELICLIHDDDLLEKDALSNLVEPFYKHENIIISYGKQFIISSEGRKNCQASKNLNATYFRTSDRSGIQNDIVKSATLQQIPNNGYLVKANLAKEVGYKIPGTIYGDACDFGFAMELALSNQDGKAFFLTSIPHVTD